MSELTEHAAQALVQTGNMTSSDKEMNGVVARIVCIHIFPKLKFTVDSDFGMDGKLFKVCHRHYTKGGGKKEQFNHTGR
jgi:hypothetical protein